MDRSEISSKLLLSKLVRRGYRIKPLGFIPLSPFACPSIPFLGLTAPLCPLKKRLPCILEKLRGTEGQRSLPANAQCRSIQFPSQPGFHLRFDLQFPSRRS